MNSKLPVGHLASLFAAKAGISAEAAESFVKAFFDRIAGELVEGHSVKIKGLGTFSPEGDAENPVVFTPDRTFADTVNAPFALFEPEVLADSVTAEALDEIDRASAAAPVPEVVESAPEAEAETATEETVEAETVVEETVAEEETPQPDAPAAVVPAPVGEAQAPVVETPRPAEIKPGVKQEIKSEVAPVVKTVEKPVEKPVVKPVPAPVDVSPVVPAPIEDEPEEYVESDEKESRGPGFGWGFVLGLLVGLALGACAVYFAIDYIFPTQPVIPSSVETVMEPLPLDSIAAPDTGTAVVDTVTPVIAAAAPAAAEPKADVQPVPVAEPVTDVIKTGYLLPDMARKHYGARVFWAYIYEENKAAIGNPNKLRPGMKLVIPAPEKYGIDSRSQASLDAADRKVRQILSRYPQ